MGDVIYHVFNRGNARQRIFHKPSDYDAFLMILAQVKALVPVRILGICLMPNHWHLILWPLRDGDLSRFMLRLTTTHVRRYFKHFQVECGGHLYQGRFKSFPVQDDDHFLVLLRYVEANALRAGLVPRAQNWKWCSLALRATPLGAMLLDELPVERPNDWVSLVNEPMTETEIQALRQSLVRGRPYGSPRWVELVAKKLGLEFTLRSRGRPRKKPQKRGTVE